VFTAFEHYAGGELRQQQPYAANVGDMHGLPVNQLFVM
jgi:hypothetical protein